MQQTIATALFITFFTFFVALSATITYAFFDGSPAIMSSAQRIAVTTAPRVVGYLALGGACLAAWSFSGLGNYWLGASCASILLGVVLSDILALERGRQDRRPTH